MRAPSVVLIASLALLGAGPAAAQTIEGYFNVESPQVRPIAIATVAGHDYLLACNTPDNAVEVYDTVDLSFVARVPTAAEPVSITWSSALSRFWVVSFLGDAVSVVRITPQGGGVQVVLERTVSVGDEPMDAALSGDGSILYVTLGSQSAYTMRDPLTLEPLPGGQRIDLLNNAETLAVKEPRAALMVGGRLVVLNAQGSKSGIGDDEYDVDLWSLNPVTGSRALVGDLGTTHFDMAASANGKLYLVGQDAQVHVKGEAALRAEPTGFVQSFLYEVTAEGSTAVIERRNLNAVAGTTDQPVAKPDALTQPTGVAVYEPAGGGRRIYVAAFGSDRVGVVDATGAGASWPIEARIHIPPHPGSSSPVTGPRGLAISNGSPASQDDPGPQVFVLNRFDNSIAVIDPVLQVHVQTFALQNDPTPARIRDGRRFLYSARLSGSGFVSCASCHIDARSEFLSWDLSDNSDQPYDVEILDGAVDWDGSPNFPPDKGEMITQSLQGMVNYATEPGTQPLFTNEPLHWRADRPRFEDFAPAFMNLLGAPAELPPTEMGQFRDFIFTVAYPPNPEQHPSRNYRGMLGDPDLRVGDGGSGARRGMKLYHIAPQVNGEDGRRAAGRSCVQCHFLPEGSNNRITDFAIESNEPTQPLETAALRLLRQKEARLVRGPGLPEDISQVVTGSFGLNHLGGSATINHFNNGADANIDPVTEMPDLNAFFRELDTGVGPLVGVAYSVELANLGSNLTGKVFATLEREAGKANVGVAARGRLAGLERGFWYDLTADPPMYREEDGPLVTTRAGLLALIATSDDLLVVHGTALGGERRFARPTGGLPAPIAAPPPSSVTLEPLASAEHWSEIPLLTRNWKPGLLADGDFEWQSATVPTPTSLRAIRIFQHALILEAPGLGLTELRHEAPRRFQVAGDGIRHGAVLELHVANDRQQPPPTTSFDTFIFPLHPTDRLAPSGKKLWQTAVEIEPLAAYAFMLGGTSAPNVLATIRGLYATEPPPPGDFDPLTWNSFEVIVRNPDGQSLNIGWVPLAIQ